MENIYIVMGTSGEYSDRRTWQVAAYKTKDEAKKHVEKVAERYRELNTIYKTYSDIPSKSNEYDLYMQTDYTGTRYYIEETDLYNDVVEYRLIT